MAGCAAIATPSWLCDNEGEAIAHCLVGLALWEAVGGTGGDCYVNSSGDFQCGVDQPFGNNCNQHAGRFVYQWTTDCIDLPDFSAHSDSTCLVSAQECQNNCLFTQSGVGVCAGNPLIWSIANMSAEGSTCTTANVGNAPDGCDIVGGVVVCDCVANPGAEFCPGGAHEDDCDQTAGIATCDPAGPPTDPGGPGPGDEEPGGPGPGESPGSSCEPGDYNCTDTGGGICGVGDTCEIGDIGGCAPGDLNCTDAAGGTCDVGEACVEGGDLGTCDPQTQNCQGEGTGSTSGSCSVEPFCSGDAIQCAILVQSWKNTCSVYDVQGEKPPWEGDADYGRDLADEAEEVDISTGLDDAGFAGGSCPADISLEMLGQTINIGFAEICNLAAIIRIFVILFTLMWAGPYVVRSFG